MTEPPILTTARLVLRPIRVDDAPSLFPVLSDAEIMLYWSSGPHATVEETRSYLAAPDEIGERETWAICLTHDDGARGWVTANGRRPGVAEIGYILDRALWGQGIAGEAVSRMLDHLFAEKGLRKVLADTDPENEASHSLLERLGFTREGYLREEWETHIGVRDTLLWGLLKREWEERRANRGSAAT